MGWGLHLVLNHNLVDILSLACQKPTTPKLIHAYLTYFLWKFYLVDAGYACRPGFLPPYHGTRYHLNEYSGRNYPTNARELFNLRHSSLRVTVERAFGALKNRFHILYNKPFHPYKTQVKLVLACCIIHNWILGHGEDEVFPLASEWEPNPINNVAGFHVPLEDNLAWSMKRDEWANLMWENRGNSHV